MKTATESLHHQSFAQIQEDQELCLSSEDYSLLTDLYQLTMTACYVGEGLDGRVASFELFARRLPEGFGYAIAMGLAQVLDYLEKFRFSPAQIAALQSTGIFAGAPERFWTLLATARFTGDVWAVPEGTASRMVRRVSPSRCAFLKRSSLAPARHFSKYRRRACFPRTSCSGCSATY